MPDQTVTVSLRASIAQYLTSMGAASKATSAFRGSLMTLGAGMTKFVTLPVLAAGAGALKVAMDWESAFAGVRKTVEATEPQLAKLEAGLRGLARQLPATHEEIAGVAEAAGQLGIAFPRIEQFTKTMIDMGETTDLSADEAAQAMARLANIMQMPQTQFERLGSTIVDLGNKGAATEAEIVNMGLRIAGAGHQIGLSEAEVASFAEALSSVGIRAEAGGSAISRAFIEINEAVNEGKRNLDILAEVAGTTDEAFAQLFREDAAGAMTLFVEGLGKVKKEGGDVFEVLADLGLEEIRLRDALLRLAGAGDLLRNSLVTGNKAWEENTALATEAEKRYATTESQLQVTINQIKDLGITIGNKLLPVAQDFLGWVSDLVKGFSNLSPAMQENILKWGLLAAAAGPLLMILSKLLSPVFLLAGGLGKLAGIIVSGSLPTAFGLMGLQLASLINPVTVLGAGLGLLAFGLYDAWQNEQKFLQGTQELGNAVGGAIPTMAEMAQETRRLANQYDNAALKQAALERGQRAMAVVQRILRQRVADGVSVLRQWGGEISAADQSTLNALTAMGDYRAAMALINRLLGGMTQGLRNYASAYDDIAAAASRAGQAIEAAQRQAAGGLPPPGGGRRQHGGPVTTGGMYMVGEAGPEMVLLPGGSYVIPNSSMTPAGGGKMAPSIVVQVAEVNVETDDAEGFADSMASVGRSALNRRGL